VNHLFRELAPVSEAAWAEIETKLAEFETEDGFVGPCELLVGAAEK